MKGIHTAASIALMSFSSLLFAQTCTTPAALPSNAAAAPNGIQGNTCTGGDNTLGNVCDNSQNTGLVAVYTWTLNGGATSGNIVVTPTGWDTAIFIGDGATCTAAIGGFCDSKADSASVGGAETLPVPTTNKTYYLFITSLAAANTCGAYNIQTGTLPVKLQKFSVN